MHQLPPSQPSAPAAQDLEPDEFEEEPPTQIFDAEELQEELELDHQQQDPERPDEIENEQDLDLDGDLLTQIIPSEELHDELANDFEGGDATELVHIDDHHSAPFAPLPDDDLVEHTTITPSIYDSPEPDSPDSAPPLAILDTAQGDPPPVDRSNISGEIPPLVAPLSPAPSPLDSPPIISLGTGLEEAEDEDFHVEKTELYQSPFENDPIRPRLSTLEGPATGQEFLVGRMRSSVGRATNNAVAIPDLSMSRQHFEIFQRADDSYAIKDLRSINGTSLNGIKIQEADLFHGDRIKAGETLFQFLIPGTAAQPNRQRQLIPAATTQTVSALPQASLLSASADASQARGSRSFLDRLLLAITIGAAILSLFLVAFLVQKSRSHHTTEPDAQEFFFAGVAAIQNRDWDQAEALFEQSHRTDPTFGDVPGQLARIESERRFLQLLEAARQYPQEELPASTLDELSQIPKQSVYFEDAQALLQLARNHEALTLFTSAQAAFDDGDFEAARRTLAKLETLAPHHEGAQKLQAALQEATTAESASKPDTQAKFLSSPQAVADAAPARTAAAAPRAVPTRRASANDVLHDPFAQPRNNAPSVTRAPINFTEGFTLYRDERFDDAIAHFESIHANSPAAIGQRALATAEDIRQFRSALRSAKNALSTGDSVQARNALNQAENADKSLAGGQGYFANSIAELRAQSFALEGLEKLEAQAFAEAFELLSRAESFSPRERETRRLARGLAERANGLYIRAVNQRKSDPQGAASLCRTILTMSPASSDTHRKARQMLDEINEGS